MTLARLWALACALACWRAVGDELVARRSFHRGLAHFDARRWADARRPFEGVRCSFGAAAGGTFDVFEPCAPATRTQ